METTRLTGNIFAHPERLSNSSSTVRGWKKLSEHVPEGNPIFARIYKQVILCIPDAHARLAVTEGRTDFLTKVALARANGDLREKKFTNTIPSQRDCITKMNPVARQIQKAEKFLEIQSTFKDIVTQKIEKDYSHLPFVMRESLKKHYARLILDFVKNCQDMTLVDTLLSGKAYPKDALNLAHYTAMLEGIIRVQKIPQKTAIQSANEFVEVINSQKHTLDELQGNALTILVKYLSSMNAGDMAKTCHELTLSPSEIEHVSMSHNRRVLGNEVDTTTDVVENHFDAPLIQAGVYIAETAGIALQQGFDVVHEVCLQNPKKPVNKKNVEKQKQIKDSKTPHQKNVAIIAGEKLGEVIVEDVRILGEKIRAGMRYVLGSAANMRNIISGYLDTTPEEEVTGLRSRVGRLLRK